MTDDPEHTPNPGRTRRVLALVMGGLVLATAGAAFFLRHEVTRAVAESKLSRVYGLDARVDGAELSLWNRRIVLHDVIVNPELSDVPEDMAAIESVEIYVHGPLWRPYGAPSHSQITLVNPRFHLTQNDDVARRQSMPSKRTFEELRGLSPWIVDEIYVEGGEGRFIDPARSFDLEFSDLAVRGRRLATARSLADEPMDLEADMKIEEAGTLHIEATSAPWGDENGPGDFDAKLQLAGFPLRSVEPVFYREKKIRVEDGYLAVSVYLHGRHGRLEGWIAPAFENVDFEGALRDGLEAPLNAFGAKAKTAVANRANKIVVEGTYAADGKVRLHATKKDNNFVQRTLFNSGAKRLRG